MSVTAWVKKSENQMGTSYHIEEGFIARAGNYGPINSSHSQAMISIKCCAPMTYKFSL